MDYKIGDTVKISVYVTEKWSRLVTCKITNKYIRNNTTYYSLQEMGISLKRIIRLYRSYLMMAISRTGVIFQYREG